MLTIAIDPSFNSPSAAYSVVVLPAPVGAATMIVPLGFRSEWRRTVLRIELSRVDDHIPKPELLGERDADILVVQEPALDEMGTEPFTGEEASAPRGARTRGAFSAAKCPVPLPLGSAAAGRQRHKDGSSSR
jgi:hypothetical protein